MRENTPDMDLDDCIRQLESSVSVLAGAVNAETRRYHRDFYETEAPLAIEDIREVVDALKAGRSEPPRRRAA